MPFFSKSTHPFMIPFLSFICGVVEEKDGGNWFDLEEFDSEDLFKK